MLNASLMQNSLDVQEMSGVIRSPLGGEAYELRARCCQYDFQHLRSSACCLHRRVSTIVKVVVEETSNDESAECPLVQDNRAAQYKYRIHRYQGKINNQGAQTMPIELLVLPVVLHSFPIQMC